MTSNTPRTDTHERWAEWNGNEFKCVPVEFARELERELAAERARAQDAVVRGLELHNDLVAATTESSTESRRAPSLEGGAAGATHKPALNDTSGTAGVAPGLSTFCAMSDSADFTENTWTFRMIGDYRVSAGRYRITHLAEGEPCIPADLGHAVAMAMNMAEGKRENSQGTSRAVELLREAQRGGAHKGWWDDVNTFLKSCPAQCHPQEPTT